jgi:hypothetical protein
MLSDQVLSHERNVIAPVRLVSTEHDGEILRAKLQVTATRDVIQDRGFRSTTAQIQHGREQRKTLFYLQREHMALDS